MRFEQLLFLAWNKNSIALFKITIDGQLVRQVDQCRFT
jgi:hypothetical protein